MPKERTRKPNKEGSGRRGKERGLGNRERDNGEHIREKKDNTRIDTLRQTYGATFAPGIRGDAHLKTLLDRTGRDTLSDYLKTTGQPPVSEKDCEDRVSEKPSKIRYASEERFKKPSGRLAHCMPVCFAVSPNR